MPKPKHAGQTGEGGAAGQTGTKSIVLAPWKIEIQGVRSDQTHRESNVGIPIFQDAKTMLVVPSLSRSPTDMSAHTCITAGNNALHVSIADHPAPITRFVLFDLIVDRLRLQINTDVLLHTNT